MVAQDRTDKILYTAVLMLVFGLVSLNVYMIMRFNDAMVVRPKQVLESIENRLAVTPEMVIQRLNEIEKSHKKWVEEHKAISERKDGTEDKKD